MPEKGGVPNFSDKGVKEQFFLAGRKKNGGK
jgi:hypothetical protein